MAWTIRTEVDGHQRYHIKRTQLGYLVTGRTRNELGLWLATEWLHRTVEAADACLDAVISFNAMWANLSDGYATVAFQQRFKYLDAVHRQICERLDDNPLVAQGAKNPQANSADADDL